MRTPRKRMGQTCSGLLLALTANLAHAQQANGTSYTDLSQYLVNGNELIPQQALSSSSQANQTSIVRQIGQNNYASANLAGIGNITTQLQNGAGNSSTLSLNGSQNSVSTTQIGNSNTTSIGVAGNGNSIHNLQVGSGLSYQLQVTGTSQPISVQQYGKK